MTPTLSSHISGAGYADPINTSLLAAKNSHQMSYQQAIEAQRLQQQANGLMMNRKMEFFNSLLDKTNKNIEIIASQLTQI